MTSNNNYSLNYGFSAMVAIVMARNSMFNRCFYLSLSLPFPRHFPVIFSVIHACHVCFRPKNAVMFSQQKTRTTVWHLKIWPHRHPSRHAAQRLRQHHHRRRPARRRQRRAGQNGGRGAGGGVREPVFNKMVFF